MFPRAVTAAKDPVMQMFSSAHHKIKLNIDRAAVVKHQMIRANLSKEMEAVTAEPVVSDVSSNKFMDSLDINSKEFGTTINTTTHHTPQRGLTPRELNQARAIATGHVSPRGMAQKFDVNTSREYQKDDQLTNTSTTLP